MVTGLRVRNDNREIYKSFEPDRETGEGGVPYSQPFYECANNYKL